MGGIRICFLLIFFLGFSSFVFRLGIQLSHRSNVVVNTLLTVYIFALATAEYHSGVKSVEKACSWVRTRIPIHIFYKLVLEYALGKFMLTINIDGASRGNPGLSGIGIVILRGGQKISEYNEFVGSTTNNIAEYTALKKALKIASTLKDDEITVLSDSELVVKQRNHSYKVRSKQLKIIFREINNLEKYFRSVSYRHIPRDLNREADSLANRAIDEHILNIEEPKNNRQL